MEVSGEGSLNVDFELRRIGKFGLFSSICL